MNANIQDFLAQKRIAVAGVSRNPRGAVANLIYRKLLETGHEVFPVNPKATSVEGDHSYPDLKSISPPVDGVVIATRPKSLSNWCTNAPKSAYRACGCIVHLEMAVFPKSQHNFAATIISPSLPAVVR